MDLSLNVLKVKNNVQKKNWIKYFIETEQKQNYVNMKKSVSAEGIINWFAFEFPNDDDILMCTIGANFGLEGVETILEDTKCHTIAEKKFSGTMNIVQTPIQPSYNVSSTLTAISY